MNLSNVRPNISLFFCIGCIVLASAANAQTNFSGTYDVGTLTPLERPQAFGDNLYLSPEQAEQMSAGIAAMLERDSARSDPNRPPPPKGRLTNGYNLFWVNPGSTATAIDGKFRTSIIYDPEDGQIPAMTENGAARLQGLLDSWTIIWRNPDPTTTKDGGTAWWLDDGNPDGPYDHIEQRPLAERCIIGSRSTAGPPMLPNFYNNFKRIIQTEQHVMILTEMNHDARVIRLDSVHADPALTFWLGDSIGWFEGPTLVVDTRNFGPTPALSGASSSLQVLERFTKEDNGDIRYQFTVDDPSVWSKPWRGEYLWRAAEGKVYEYACHEGNYALGNIMRGARELEAQAQNP